MKYAAESSGRNAGLENTEGRGQVRLVKPTNLLPSASTRLERLVSRTTRRLATSPASLERTKKYSPSRARDPRSLRPSQTALPAAGASLERTRTRAPSESTTSP